MPTKITIKADNTKSIDLGNSAHMIITAIGGNAEVYVDYQLHSGQYSSAIKGSSGYGNPFTVIQDSTKAVRKTDLESENVRVGVKKADITVIY